MNRLTLPLAALLAGATLTLTSPAHAATPCTSAELSPAEWSAITPGQTLAQVRSIVGSPGTLVSTSGSRSEYSWTYCANGSRLPQRLSFVTPPPRFGSQPILTSKPLPGR